ncbi:hypothetical protein GN316_05255 [Xylophilus sp. Kf1]|nr:hypothetical protein [Xylophilus sp. Kf1]
METQLPALLRRRPAADLLHAGLMATGQTRPEGRVAAKAIDYSRQRWATLMR